MTPPAQLATALRHQAQGIYCCEAAAELLIAHGTWLHRTDFTTGFAVLSHGLTDGRPMATIDWAAAITALAAGHLPCSGGEQRMLRLIASIADGERMEPSSARRMSIGQRLASNAAQGS